MGPTCRRKTIFSANTLNIPTTEKKKKRQIIDDNYNSYLL